MTSSRMFRLAPPDRTGLLLGLGAGQLTAGGTTVLVASMLFARHHPGVAIGVASLGACLVFGRWRRQPVVEWMAAAGRLLAQTVRGRRRFRALPIGQTASANAELPAPLGGQRIVAVPGDRYGWRAQPFVAVVHDTRTGRYAATVRVAGERFALLGPQAQAAAVERWGEVLAGWCREQSAISQIRWCETAIPAGVEAHRTWLAANLADVPVHDALVTYLDLLAEIGTVTTGREVLVTLVADATRVTTARRRRGRHDRMVDALLAEVASFQARAVIAGLAVSEPLSPGEVGQAIRSRFDPWSSPQRQRLARSLGATVAHCDPMLAGPLATAVGWTGWTTDAVTHRAFVAVDWPRAALPADWFAQVLMAGGAARTVCAVFEPIAPSRSRRAIRFAATKLEGDEQTRLERGFHVPAALRHQRQAVTDREDELEHGHGDLAYSALVVVSGRTTAELDAAAAALTNVAASAGIDLRPLHGRHELAVVATLPLARGITSPSTLREVVS